MVAEINPKMEIAIALRTEYISWCFGNTAPKYFGKKNAILYRRRGGN